MRYGNQSLIIVTLLSSTIAAFAQERVESDKPAAADAGRLAEWAAKAKMGCGDAFR